MTVRILVADDQELVRAGFAAVLGTQPDFEVVAEAGTGREAVDLVRAHRPDVVLMDVRMPDLDGIGATAENVVFAYESEVVRAGDPAP